MDDMERTLGRVEGKIDGILEHLERQNGRLDDHGQRIRHVEQKQWWLAGLAAGFGGAMSFLKDWMKMK